MNAVKTKLLGLICLLSCVACGGCGGELTVVDEAVAVDLPTDADRLDEAQAYLSEVISEPDVRLRPIAAVIRENGESFKSESTWNNEKLIASWQLNRSSSIETPSEMRIAVPKKFGKQNTVSIVIAAFDQVNPLGVFKYYQALSRAADNARINGRDYAETDDFLFRVTSKSLNQIDEFLVEFCMNDGGSWYDEVLLSEQQISTLYMTSWDADDEGTRNYQGNANNPEVADQSWVYAVQWKARGFFKDAGFLMTIDGGAPEPVMRELDFNKDQSASFRFIDEQHFAIWINDFWLVFKERNQ